MVDEKTATRALTGRRQLSTSMQSLKVDYDTLSGQWQPPESRCKQWKPVAGAFSSWYIEDTFDLSGYNRDYLTALPYTAFNQEAGRIGITYPGNTRIICLDLITEKRVDVSALTTSFTSSNSNCGLIPSFPGSTDDWSQVIYGRYREYTGMTQGTVTQDIFTLYQDDRFGSLEGTTNDKLWVYKIIFVLGIPATTPPANATLRFPNSRTVLGIDVVKEEELEFLMRQKRSYELTNY